MKFALVFDNNEYKVVKLLKIEKKFVEIALLDDSTDKKIKIVNFVLEFDANNESIINTIAAIKAEVDLDLLWELSQDTQEWTLNNLRYVSQRFILVILMNSLNAINKKRLMSANNN